MTQNKLIEYANLVVEIGVNLQKGQNLVISCPVECAAFCRLVTEAAYKKGARDVIVRWQDDALDRLRYASADDSVFDEVPAWIKAQFEEYTNPQTAKLTIYSSAPDNLRGVSPDRIQRQTIASGTTLKKYHDMQIANIFQWCVVSVPTRRWAANVFTGMPAGAAEDKLWNAILSTVRVDGDGTAVEKWREHIARLHERVERLNNYHFSRLVYKNSLGTDLTVELPDKHVWLGGIEKTQAGVPFAANIPTEEVFTLPVKTGVNGVVYSSMPLSLNGNLIIDIKLTLKDGRITDASAREGLDILTKQLDADEGARYLGEVALVPYNSAISEQGILYYNTLFDENAACHFAFGSAYPAFENIENMTREEQITNGMNDSIVHVDFMVGTPDLSITGVTFDGRSVPVFTEGNFAF